MRTIAGRKIGGCGNRSVATSVCFSFVLAFALFQIVAGNTRVLRSVDSGSPSALSSKTQTALSPSSSGTNLQRNSTRQHALSAKTKNQWLICAKFEVDSTASNCSVAAEKLLLESSTDELEQIFFELIRSYEDRYRQAYADLIQNATTIVADAENRVQPFLASTFGNLHDSNKEIFNRLYLNLVWYSRTTVPLVRGRFHQKPEFSVSPAWSVRRIFRGFLVELAEWLVAVRSPQLAPQLTGNYLQCVANLLASNQSSAVLAKPHVPRSLATLLSDSLFAPVERPMIAIRVWLNVYLSIAKFTKDLISQLPITEECLRAFGAVRTCYRCSAIPSVQPCQQTCETVAQTCMNLSSYFTENWQQFIDTTAIYARDNDLNASLLALPELLNEFPRRLSEAIANITSTDLEDALNDKVFEECKDYEQDDGADEVAAITQATAAAGSAQNNRRQLEQAISGNWVTSNITSMFKSLEGAIVSSLCEQAGQDTNCWNGVTQLRTNPRSLYSGRFAFESAVNYTQRQAESVEHSKQFYDDYAVLFRDYAAQIRTGGTLRAGHTLASTGYNNRPEKLETYSFDDEFGDDEGSGAGVGTDAYVPNSDDEDELDASGLEFIDSVTELGSGGDCEFGKCNNTVAGPVTVIFDSEVDADLPAASNERSEAVQPPMPAQPQPQPPASGPGKPEAPRTPSRTSAASRSRSVWLLNLFILCANFAVLFHLVV